MSDEQLIDEAYGSIMKTLYVNFFQAYTSAKGNPADEEKAEDTFRKGVKHARHVRDRAKAILP